MTGKLRALCSRSDTSIRIKARAGSAATPGPIPGRAVRATQSGRTKIDHVQGELTKSKVGVSTGVTEALVMHTESWSGVSCWAKEVETMNDGS